jgi:hypothetical protein
MMEFEHHDDIQLIKGFVGKTCERTLACNSIKLRFEHTTEGDLRLIFDHDFNLRIPFASNRADDEDFYTHWYASAGEVLTQEAQERQV